MSCLSNSRGSSPGPGWDGFDPLRIGPNHVDHAQSTRIIILEESGRIFCPICLERQPLEGIRDGNPRHYDVYLKNLLEILDQHTEQIKLRRVALLICEILLKKKVINFRGDNEFHNLLRVLHKLLNSDQSCNFEFHSIINIYSNVLENFDSTMPIPLAPIWATTRSMLRISESELVDISLDTNKPLSKSTCEFIKSISTIIKSYMKLLTRFENTETCDRVFQLVEYDYTKHQHFNMKTDSQLDTIDFMSRNLVNKCFNFYHTIDRELVQDERDMAIVFFNTLDECLKTCIKRKHLELLEYVCKNEGLLLAHSMICKNTTKGHNGHELELRQSLRQSLKGVLLTIVRHYIVLHYGTDEIFERYIKSRDIVETNFKNAIHCSTQERHQRTTFYILVNCVAIILDSSYFVASRVRKVIKLVDPEPLDLRDSKVLMRAYFNTAAHVSTKATKLDNVKGFVLRILKRMHRKSYHNSFDEEFCFNEKILHWVYDLPEFIELARVESLKYILEGWAIEKRQSAYIMNDLLKHPGVTTRDGVPKTYKRLIIRYLENEDSSMTTIEEIVRFDSEQAEARTSDISSTHEELVPALSHIIMSIFHSSILHSINNDDETGRRKVHRSIKLIIMMMENCRHFKLVLDDQYIEDMFKYLEAVYNLPNIQEQEDTLILINEFISLMMTQNSPYLMKILKHLDYSILGYMFNRLADYTKDDRLAESIANLLVEYDNIDYPLIQNIGRSLNDMALSVINWMLSRNENLHILSLMIAKYTLDTNNHSDSIKACVTTALIHMLTANPNVLENRVYINHLLAIVDKNAFKFNPLVRYALENLPNNLKNEIKQKLGDKANDPPSPPLSFSSGGSSFFEEQHCTVAQILNQLSVEEEPRVSSHIPDSLYIAGSVRDQHLGKENIEEWERVAQNAAAF